MTAAVRLDGKVALVTGAGRGIGRAEALLLASLGAKVVVNDLGGGSWGGGGDPAIAPAVVEEIRKAGGEAVAETSSVSSWEGGRRAVQATIDAFGRIDILSNNAGIARPRRLDAWEEADWDLVHDVHMKGYAATIRHAAPHFIAQKGGVIVNKSSPSGFGHYSNGAYTAAKEGVVGLTRAAARDLGQFGVRCNAIRPIARGSQMSTDPMSATLEDSEALGIPALWNRPRGLPMAVTPDPQHVAALTAWLCSDASANLNGREVFIAGAEVGLLPEPEMIRTLYAPGGWTLEAFLDPAVTAYLAGDARNRFRGRS
ncbi:MAG: SDR family oxidoreductase [Caulobacteraceae bacterium]|nr:SDR family oxidoreductase [Caulobacteraceae bacterium]